MGERRVTADGRILEKQPDGSIVEVGRQGGQQGGVFTIPESPRQIRKDNEDSYNKNRDYELQRKKFIAELATKGQTLDANDNIVPIPNWQPPLTPDQMQDRQGRAGRLNSLVAQINRTQELGNKGPLATSGLSAIADYNPFLDANARFDTAGASLSQQGLGAFRVPGTGTVSDRDAIMFDRANLPQASTLDASNQEILRGLRNRVEEEYRALGLPAPQWVGASASEQQDERRDAATIAGSGGGEPPIFPGNVQGGVRPPNVWMSDGTPMRDVPTQGSAWNAITGNTNTKYQRYPDIEKKVSQAFMAGASLEQLNQILASDPRTAGHFIRPTDYAEGAKARASGRKGDVTFTVGANVPLTRREEFSGSPTASAGAGFANMMSLGGVEALAPQQYGDQKALNPNAAFAGEVVGAVAGSQGIGSLSRETIGRAFPRLLGGGGKARVARQVAQDTAYGAGYGGVVNGDPVSGGLMSGAGSLVGQGLGKVVGKSFAGLTKTPFARELEEAGIDSLTVGQNLGGLAARTEDRAMSVPGVGDLIRNRRIDAFEDYNRAEFANAGRPIGFSPPNIRSQGIDELDAAKSAAYSNTLDPVTINVLDDPQLAEDVARAQMQAMRIPNVKPTFPRDYSASSLNNRLIDPVSPEGVLTGRNFQEGYRGLARDARTRANSDYGNEIGEVARSGQNALAGALERQNPGAYSGFLNANTANRNISVLRDAVGRARNGGRTGELEVFAPSQMIDAAAANARKFPGGYNTNLAKAAQRVLPSTVPDSGSAGRLLQYALPTALVGGGVGGYTGGEDGAMTGAGTPLALAALLMAGGSKGGQAALNKLLFSRKSLPARAAKVTGTKIDEQKGLLGSLLGGYLSTKD